ncbi:MAG TPA: ComEA family DNA-binding protein, partial [Actinomycetes bacterium]|nr:ComEA family DNA-binding protein [Actinomycetes bacterium]
LCAAAVALALGALWRSHATPAPLTALSSAPSATSAPAAAPRASSSPAVVVVDVAGKVRRPGVVRLPAGSRVVDALRAAGGALRGVDLTDLNLARALQDGEQVVVGSTVGTASAPPAPGAAAAASPARVNLNAATLADLETLPGIGPALGQRILDWRSAHGRFSSVQELREVSGIGDARFAVLAPRVSV